MTSICQFYGHNYRKQWGRSGELPPGYVIEECAYCGDERTVLEY